MRPPNPREIIVPSRFIPLVMGTCLTLSAAPAIAQDIPWGAIESLHLNPTSFYVSISVSHTVPDCYFALEAYEGPPVGHTGGFQRVIVSAWEEGNGSSLVLYDTSTPLSYSGRTYNVALTPAPPGDYLLGPNEVFAPYPFFTAPVISAFKALPPNGSNRLAVTFGEGLYTNTVYIPDEGPSGFIRIRGTNPIPTNAVVERSPEPGGWSSE